MKGFSNDSKPTKRKNAKKIKLSIEEAVKKATILQKNGSLREASLIYEKLLSINCKDSNFLSNYAVLLKNRGEYKKAKDLITEAIQIYPRNSNNYSNLSLIFFKELKFKDALEAIKKALVLEPNNHSYLFNSGLFLFQLGRLESAKSVFEKVIKISPSYHKGYGELAITYFELGEFDYAEKYIRKAIELDSSNRNYFSNLASILTSKGDLDQAGEIALNTISNRFLNAKPLFILSNSNKHNNNEIYLQQLFCEKYEESLLDIDKVDLFFARANILHKQHKFNDSAYYLSKANNLKLSIFPSDAAKYVRVVNKILNFSSKIECMLDKTLQDSSIFIVGMPRSGSTLTESIISMNKMVIDLGESRFLEQAFIESKVTEEINNASKIRDLYYKKINTNTNINTSKNFITTDKQLYNFAYISVIISQFPNAKIIHCIRNPLDNILSMYRAHFARESRYSSSLIDASKIYILHDKVINNYKSKYKNNIYTLNYDFLVQSPNIEIRKLIAWLGWEWNDCYLNPHLNKRSVSTASNIQVRSPINNKSIGGWKNYKKLLKPAIDEFLKLDKYKYLGAE